MAESSSTFRSTVRATGKTTTGIPVPAEVVTGMGKGKRPPVKVTVNDYSYRTTVASVGGEFMLSVSAEVRERARLSAGDDVEVQIELDSQPREVEMPADFAAALASEPGAKNFFDSISYSKKRWFVSWIEQAKRAETRQERVAKSVAMLNEGKTG